MQETTSITPNEIDPKRRYLCRHIFTEGHRCGSPALRGQSLCYNHNRSRREAGIAGKSGTFPMPRIDDRASIQLALFEVLSRLAGGDIEFKRGSILLYGLQIASSNLPRHAKADAEQQPQVEDVTADYRLGDLAPITEIPECEPLTPAQESIEEVVILSAAKHPRIQPELPQIHEEAQPLAAHTRESAHSANRAIQTAPAQDGLILAAVQAVGTQPDLKLMTEPFRWLPAHGSTSNLAPRTSWLVPCYPVASPRRRRSTSPSDDHPRLPHASRVGAPRRHLDRVAA